MARLVLSFLGPFQATLDSLPVKGFESDKVRALLAYMAVEAGQPHRRDSLAALLWPEQGQDVALKNLRHVLYKLRQALGEADENSQAPYLLVSAQTVQFNTASDFQLDVTEFTELVEACRAHNHRRIEVCGSCHLRLTRAAELYRGNFLAGFSLPDSIEFEEWMLLQREALHQGASLALVYLASYSEARGDNLRAATYARKQLELEPWNEEAHRHLMRLLWVTKQRTAALTQYQKCRRTLLEELGIEPGPETQTLYRRILAGEYKEADLAPDETPARLKHNLPVQVTPFIGREAELGGIAERLESQDRRLLTIVGPGGMGKSRLALSAAANQLGAFGDGVYFVPMAPVATPDLIASTVAQAVSLHFSGKQDEESQLLQYLAGKEMLLVMDNVEHLLEGVGILRKILEAAPRVALLVTSREQLNFRAESVIEITGLSFPLALDGEPWEAGSALSPEKACEYSAVQLFIERAGAVQEGFHLTADTARTVAQICRLVGGLPLALELAAVYVLDFSCEEIAAAIQANLDFLAADMHDVSAAHSSIRAVFNYSWQFLTEEERGVFRRLSVFRGGWDVEAAERVAGASRALLRSLASKSLIRRVGQDTDFRYSIHEVLRQYAAEQLEAAASEKASVQELHAEYFLELAEVAEPNLRGPQQETWLHRLDQEHANLQAAIHWAAETGRRELGLRLGGALWQFWVMHAHYATGRALLSGLELGQTQPTPAWAKALFGAGRLAMQQGDHTSAHRYMERSLALYRALGDDEAVRKVIVEQARAYLRQGNYPRAEALSTEALELARAAGDLRVMVSALTHLGNIAANHNDYAKARRLNTECLRINRDMEDKWGVAWTLTNLGNLAHSDGDSESARPLLEESLAIRREIGDKWGIAACLTSLGSIATEEGCYREGREYLVQGLALRREIGDVWAISESFIYFGFLQYSEGNFDRAIDQWWEGLSQTYAQENHFFMTYCLTGLAAASLKKGNTEQAVSLAGTTGALLDTLGVRLSPAFQRLYDEVLKTGQTLLGEAEWSRVWAEGRKMTLDAAYKMARTL